MQQLEMKEHVLLTMDVRDLINERRDAGTIMLFDRFRQQMKAGAMIDKVEVTDLAIEHDGELFTQYNLRVHVDGQVYLITIILWDNAAFALDMMRSAHCIDSAESIRETIRKMAVDHA